MKRVRLWSEIVLDERFPTVVLQYIVWMFRRFDKPWEIVIDVGIQRPVVVERFAVVNIISKRCRCGSGGRDTVLYTVRKISRWP